MATQIDMRTLERLGAGLRMEALETELAALRAEFPDLAVARDRARPTVTALPASAGWKARWYARLQRHGPERLAASSQALNTSGSVLLTSARGWLEAGVIQKLEPGVYGVGTVAPC